MRDAVGGSFMIKVFIVFLGVYIVFMAIAFNFARAFRVKNEIINIIEQNEGLNENDLIDNSSGSQMTKIHNYLGTVNYTTESNVASNNQRCKVQDSSVWTHIDDKYDFCIRKYQYSSSGSNGYSNSKTKSYYKVVTFVSLEIPFFGINIPVPIEGETRMIERINT